MGSQTFELRCAGRQHRLVVTDVGLRRRYDWTCDGVAVASTTSVDDRVTLTPVDPSTTSSTGRGVGRVVVRAGLTGVKRASLVADDVEVDLVPAAGSPAARREERVRAHPRRHIVLHTTAAVAKVLIPLLGIGLAISWLPSWDLPRIPWPDVDLPSIPWPSIDLPSIPLPDWERPEWLRAVMEKSRYVLPVLLAVGLARREVKRREQQDARRAQLDDTAGGTDDTPQDEPHPNPAQRE